MILHKKQVQNLPIDPPTGKPKPKLKDTGYNSEFTYNFNTFNPFLSNWIDNDTTRKKLTEQTGNAQLADNTMKTLSGLTIIDGQKIKKELGYMDGRRDVQDVLEGFFKTKTSKGRTWVRDYIKKTMKTFPILRGYYDPYSGKSYQYITANRVQKGKEDAGKSGTHEAVHASEQLQTAMDAHIKKTYGSSQISMADAIKIAPSGAAKSASYLNKFRNLDGGPTRDKNGKVLKFGEGTYPRFMQMRNVMQLKPGQKVTPEMLKKYKDDVTLRRLRYNWDYKTLAKMFTDLAVNDKTPTQGNPFDDQLPLMNTDQNEYTV